MKILITAPSLDETVNVSGISTVVSQIIKRGAFDYQHFTAGRRDGERKNLEWFKRQFALPREFRAVIRREKIELAHINTAFNPLSILRDLALARAAKRENLPLVLHLHGGKFLARDFENPFWKILAEKMLRRADLILVLSELEKEILKKRWRNLPVEVLHNAVAVEKDLPQKNNDLKTIIFLGRMTESKGLNEIIAACRQLKAENLKFNFRAFGAGDLMNFFTAEMKNLLGENFFYGGVIAGAKKQSELNRADIFVLPSRYGEGLPMAMLEAMAANCVPVVSEMASVGAVIENEKNGFLIEPGNTGELTEALKSLLRNEFDLEKIGANARRTIEEKFDLDEYIKKLESFYRSVAA